MKIKTENISPAKENNERSRITKAISSLKKIRRHIYASYPINNKQLKTIRLLYTIKDFLLQIVKFKSQLFLVISRSIAIDYIDKLCIY